MDPVMPFDNHRPQLGYRGSTHGWRARSLFARVLAIAAAAVLLVGAIAVSILVFAVALTALTVLGVYLWWRTRELRRAMRMARARSEPIEGEIIRPEDDEQR
jgi:Flp pilus assembly protein TadB